MSGKQYNPSAITPEISAEILRLYAAGCKPKDIAPVVGLSRVQVNTHVNWKTMTPERRADRLRANNDRRREQRRAILKRPARRIYDERPPAEVIADRDRRLSRGFMMHVDLLGDPEPGRSALDRRQMDVRA